MTAIGSMISSLASGLGDAVKGIGNIVGGALSLNPQQIIGGASQLMSAPATAANTLISSGLSLLQGFGR